MPRERNALIKITSDLLIVLAVGIPILIFHLKGEPKQRGFFCDDDSIRYPYRDSTVTNIALYIVGIFVPVVVICFTEIANDMRSKRDRSKAYIFFGRPVPYLVGQVYVRVGVFLFGACVSQIITDIAKYSIGRLRPHFLDVCKPDVDCMKELDPHAYVQNFHCTGTDTFRIRESRLSFPSGHSSFSAYTMFYTVLYLQACMRCPTNKLLRPFLQFILVLMTWYTALSRISDYKHHWSDVMIGFLLGIIVAFIVFFFVSDCFKTEKKDAEAISLQNVSADAQLTTYNTMDLEQQST